MFYIVKSNSKSLRDKIISKIVETGQIENDNIFKFDFEEENDFEKAFSEYLTFNFDNKNKVVILKNSSFLNLVKPEKKYEDRFIKSIDIIDNQNIIILTIDKLNKTGKLNNKFSGKIRLIEKDSPQGDELIMFIQNFFSTREIAITPDLSKRIIERLNGDFDLIVSEIKKLSLLSIDKITNEIIDSVVLDFSKESLFKLADAVLTLDEKKISKLINQLITQGESFYLVSERLAMEFSKVLRYKVLSDIKHISDLDFQKLTNWNMWGIRNYSKWIKFWPSQKIMLDFFYDIVLWKGFFDILNGNPNDPLRLLEKLLVSNVIKVKELNNESK